MESVAGIRIGTKTLWSKLSHLQAAEIAASHFGFFDLDVDSDDRGVKIVATAPNRSVTAKGRTLELAVENMIGVFSEH